MTEFSHSYSVIICPSCKADLTKSDSITMIYVVSDGGPVGEIPTCLDTNGLLRDVGHLIANGHHAGTDCASCSANLSEYELIDEEKSNREALERIYDILQSAEDAGDACLSIGEIVAKALERSDPITGGKRSEKSGKS